MAVSEALLAFALEEIAGSAFRSVISKILGETRGVDEKERFQIIMQRLASHDQSFGNIQVRLADLEKLVSKLTTNGKVHRGEYVGGAYFNTVAGGANAFRNSFAKKKETN